ncbi:hypothetical protein [Maritimibacter sp. DP1N21-5]|uniref:hypothetical protein n=1 Tax=Maritimibacter sp. DP1N21-5 TaxID=2836867 RepID=UPI001C443440|nr:hypothetical protein [Maritimibacter sp. DP1N21-5]MBV7408186.1 hypothetical protein [Maritimibacter sp. DP1N21-5]
MSVDPRAIVRLQMSALIEKLGGFDAACAVLEARWGHSVSKGTLSKKKAGDLDYTVSDLIALQSAAGEFPVTEFLIRDMRAQGGVAKSEDLLALSGVISKETGEAIAAVLGLLGAETSDGRAATIKEIDEAISAMTRIRRALEG